MFDSCYMVTKFIMVTNPLTAKLMLLLRVSFFKVRIVCEHEIPLLLDGGRLPEVDVTSTSIHVTWADNSPV